MEGKPKLVVEWEIVRKEGRFAVKMQPLPERKTMDFRRHGG